jgi:hypothetical protein
MTKCRAWGCVSLASQVVLGAAIALVNVSWAADNLAGPTLVVYPARVQLSNSRDRQAVAVQVKHPDGSTRDASSASSFAVTDSAIATVNGGELHPVGDGKTELIVQFEGLTERVPVEVVDAKASPPLRFRNDVLPIFSRAGCNTGKCHGAASGKDGFRLSLFGYDPAGDHYRLTREMPGRRINVASPADCLLINKATGMVPHTGGERIEPESNQYQTLLAWLAEGAPVDPPETARPTRIEVFPPQAVFANKDQSQQLIVVAYYSDGTDRDVTDRAVFLSNNDAAATVTEDGLVSGSGSGGAFILARFDQFTEGASIVVRPGRAYMFPPLSAANYVDELVFEHWRDLHLLPSELCSDEVFLRRVTLDLIGLLPTAEERRAFLSDRAANKRDKLVESLVEREEFRDLWVMKWAELLQIRTNNGVSPKGLALYDQWLRERVRAGTPIHKIVEELIPASGGTFDNPATSYYQTETTPQLLAENVAQAFLGTRIQCAQCHNHPFDRWTMDDYYGFAAFFSQVGYKQAADPREITVFNAAAGEIKHPLGGRSMTPKYLGGDSPPMAAGQDYRQSLAVWLASAGNEAFSRNLANLVWTHFFGIGIVEPVDDVRVSNPPSNPRLFNALGEKLAAYEFDTKPLVRDICQSRTYQLSTQRNASNAWDERHFSHGRVRRLRAEVLLDCINQVTETRDRLPGLPQGGRAVQIADGRTPNYFLTTFGRSTRQTACTCEVKTSPTLSQALHLINGETTSGKIAEGQVIERLLTEGRDPAAVVSDLYERCLARRPTPKEVAAIQVRLAAANDVPAALADLFWAVLNSNEFLFNH